MREPKRHRQGSRPKRSQRRLSLEEQQRRDEEFYWRQVEAEEAEEKYARETEEYYRKKHLTEISTSSQAKAPTTRRQADQEAQRKSFSNPLVEWRKRLSVFRTWLEEKSPIAFAFSHMDPELSPISVRLMRQLKKEWSDIVGFLLRDISEWDRWSWLRYSLWSHVFFALARTVMIAAPSVLSPVWWLQLPLLFFSLPGALPGLLLWWWLF